VYLQWRGLGAETLPAGRQGKVRDLFAKFVIENKTYGFFRRYCVIARPLATILNKCRTVNFV
jgi:hypothetical protein